MVCKVLFVEEPAKITNATNPRVEESSDRLHTCCMRDDLFYCLLISLRLHSLYDIEQESVSFAKIDFKLNDPTWGEG